MEDLIRQLAEVKESLDSMAETSKVLRATEATIKAELQAKLEENGIKSAKSSLGTVSIASKQRLVVTDEDALMKWIKDTPELEDDMYIKTVTSVDMKGFEPAAKQWQKETGEMPSGVEVQSSEYFSFRKAK